MSVSLADAYREVIEYPARHLRVMGPAGSGKTALVVERYKALARALAGDVRRVYILTYSRESLKRLTGAILADGQAHAGLPPILTHFTLAMEMIAATGRAAPRVVDGVEEQLLLENIIDRKTKLLRSDYRAIISSRGLQKELLGVFHLLLQNRIVDEALEKLSAAVNSARLSDVLLLYDAFVTVLRSKALATYYDISWIAASHCRSGAASNPLADAAVLLVDDFQDVDAGQFELLQAVTPPTGEAAVNVFGDPMGAFFGFRGTDARYLNEEFVAAYPCETFRLAGATPDHHVLGAVQERLLRETLGDEAVRYLPLREHNTAAGKPHSMPAVRRDAWHGDLFDNANRENEGGGFEASIEITGDEVEEVYSVAARVQRLVTSGRYHPNDVAVVTNQKNRYEPLLKMAFSQRGIPLESGRVVDSVFRHFTYSMLTLLGTPDNDVAVRSVLTSPFYPCLQNECLKTAAASAAGDGRAAEDLRNFVQGLERTLRSTAAEEWMTVLSQRVLLPTCRAYRDETDDETVFGAMSHLIKSWDGYVEAAESAGNSIDISSFLRLSDFFSDQTKGPRPSKREVGLFSCREIKGTSFPVVLVVGCAELLFPSVTSREGILPTRKLQEHLADVWPEQAVRFHRAQKSSEHLREQYHLLYMALTRGTESIHLTAPEQFDGMAHPAPAGILAETLPMSAMQRRTAELERTPPQIRFAEAWIEAPSSMVSKVAGLGTKLAQLNPISAFWKLDAPDAPLFTIDPFRLSQTWLKTFLACRRQFFYRRVLRLPEDDSPAKTMGFLFHDVMAELGRRYPSKGELQAASSGAILKIVEQVFEAQKSLPGGALVRQLLRLHVERMVMALVREDLDKSEEYTVGPVEESIQFSWDDLAFGGRLDRTEVTSTGGTFLVDYKTGANERKMGKTIRGFVLNAVEKPDKANWQVPLYVWGYEKAKSAPPDAFKLAVSSAGQDPFFVTLYIRDREEDVPARAFSDKQPDRPFSYLLASEIEASMRKAGEVADEIFTARAQHEKTDNRDHCRTCTFRRLCDRDKQ